MPFLKHTFLYYALIIAISLWTILFLVFCLITITLKYTPLDKADAIVVLTGGKDHRIQTGIDLLNQKWADTLFISGVNTIVQSQDIFKDTSTELQSAIQLGYMAQNTHTNALEVAQWVRKTHVKSIILVTSFYHMPRSLLEMRNVKLDLKIIPHSIFPKEFNESTNWIHTRYMWHLFIEYHKFIATFFKNSIKG